MSNFIGAAADFMPEALTYFTYALMGLAVLAGIAGVGILIQIIRGKIGINKRDKK